MRSSIRVLSIIGTRPDAIKMAPLILLLNAHLGDNHKVCCTGQHRELLDAILAFFEIIPDYDLGIMTSQQDVASVVGKVILSIAPVLDEFAPDWVLVHGDTSTCLGATIASFYRKIKIGHVEAGLRSGSLAEPFPEESVRLITDQLSEICFAPTDLSRVHLLNSGKREDRILKTGNTGIDSLKIALKKVNGLSEKVCPVVRKLLSENRKIILLTVHRRENQGENLLNICSAVKEISLLYSDVHFLLPLHPNPAVKDILQKQLSGIDAVTLCTQLDYPDFIWAMKNCFLVLTDSGGIQEEAPVLGKPVLLLRNRTERNEMVITGNVKIIGTETKTIVDEVGSLWNNPSQYSEMTSNTQIYGDGTASEQIVHFLLNQ